MPYIYNTRDEKVSVQAFGNWFTFNPGQIKVIHNEKAAEFIAEKRREDGLVNVPDEAMESVNSDETKALLAEKKKEGVTAYIVQLERRIHNLEVSLKRDLAVSNLQYDPMAEATQGDLEAYKQLAKYKEFQRQQDLNKADEIRKLKEQISGNTVATNTGAIDSGSPSRTETKKS